MNTTHNGHVTARYAFLVFLLSLLAACGGGGGGGTTEKAQSATPGSSSDSVVMAHTARLNTVRMAMGLPTLGWNANLEAAARNHAAYLSRNGTFGHGELESLPGYTGQGYGDRAAHAGYGGQLVGEVIVGGQPVTAADGAALMDVLLASPGHRFVLLAPDFAEVGSAGLPLTTLVGARGSPWYSVSDVWVYPHEGMSNVALAFAPATEPVNPLPSHAVTGTPISLHAGLFTSFRVSGAVLEKGDGTPHALVHAQPADEARSAFVFYPAQALAPSATYVFRATVHIAGSSRAIRSIFTTAPA